MEYPEYWLCKCGHELREHKYGGLNKFGWGGCSVKAGTDWIDGCGMFHEADNLTQIEHLAKVKNLI